MNSMVDYTPSDATRWTGRVDDPEARDAFRWHQVIQCLNLSAPVKEPSGLNYGFCFLGYCCDHGVKLNLGRTGAAGGPEAIRGQLANLPVNFPKTVGLFDGGDIQCLNGDLESARQTLTEAVKRILDLSLFPIVLGGGHDLAYGHFGGIMKHFPKSSRLGILNFDAHFDLRPLRPAATSGTMFTQIAENCQKEGISFSYFCVGIQKSANTANLFKVAEMLGVETVLAKEVYDSNLELVKQKMDTFIAGNDAIYVTICADVFSSAFSPGVSSPQPFGLHPEMVLCLLKHVLESGKVVSFDIAEVSPRFDSDDHTAKLAAVIIYALVNALTQSGSWE